MLFITLREMMELEGQNDNSIFYKKRNRASIGTVRSRELQ